MFKEGYLPDVYFGEMFTIEGIGGKVHFSLKVLVFLKTRQIGDHKIRIYVEDIVVKYTRINKQRHLKTLKTSS